MIRIPEVTSYRSGPHQNSARSQERYQLPDECGVIRHVLQNLIAVDQVKLSRSRSNSGEPGKGGRSAKFFGLGNGSRGKVVTDRFSTELLQADSEDSVHAPKIENPLPVG